MGKTILYGSDARNKLNDGVSFLARAVASSLGPAGRNTVIYNRHGGAILTKDGVTIAEAIEAEDLATDAGVQLVKQVARKTSDSAGDGTTTATVLAQAIYKGGLEAITAKANPVVIKRGIDKAVAAVCGPDGFLDSVSCPVVGDAIVQVGTIAANNDPEIGKIIAEALRAAGANGVITVDDSKTFDTSLERVEGMEINSGYVSPYFVNEFDRQECILENCRILIHEQKLSSMKALAPLLEDFARTKAPLLILAEAIEGDLLAMLVLNRLRGNLNVCAVKAPGVGAFRKELLIDIAALTGGKAIIQDLGIATEKIGMAELGTATRVVVKKERTVISGGIGTKDAIDIRIAAIRAQLPLTESPYERDRMQERLAKLSGGVSIIKVGAASEVELLEKKARIEDAVHATRAAIEQGIVPGGGVTLARLSEKLTYFAQELSDDEKAGALIVRRSMLEPLKCIAANAGEDGESILKQSLSGPIFNIGFNALTGEFCDLMEAGIVDPTMVVRLALQNAASVAGSMLTTECLIVQEVKADIKQPKLPGRA